MGITAKTFLDEPDPEATLARARDLLQQRLEEISRATDRRFARLTVLEWLAAVAAAIWISPRTWAGQTSSIHPHIWFAVVLGGLMASLPVALALLRPGYASTRHVIAATQMLMAGMLVHMTGGRIETHFSYFGLLAFLAFYRDWRVLLTATIVTSLDHLLRAGFWPESMYGVLSVGVWRPFEHAGWVLFEVIILTDFMKKSLESLGTNVGREARLEKVSERIASEVAARTAELAESEQRYRILFESCPLPMWLCDADTLMFIAANHQARHKYGYSQEEFLAMHASGIDASEPSDTPFLSDGLNQAIPMTRRRHRRKDGVLMEVEVTSRLIDWSGRTVLLILSNDVSDRVRAERDKDLMEVQLRHAHKLESIGQLAAGIAHEINTPTQYIGDNLHFLQDAFNDLRPVIEIQGRALPYMDAVEPLRALSSEIRKVRQAADVDYLAGEIPKSLDQAIEGVGRVSTLVKAMKEFSHPGSKDKVPADLNTAILSTVTVARNEWKYVARLDTALDPDLPLVPCMVSDFNQVMLNLIVNAAHAIGEAMTDGATGTITISTHAFAEYVEVRVQDTGTGIPPHVRDRIFDPFFTTKEVGKGTGQGLAIARSVVVDKHGGTLHFETETGAGTTFIVRLPLEDSKTRAPLQEDCVEVPAAIR